MKRVCLPTRYGAFSGYRSDRLLDITMRYRHVRLSDIFVSLPLSKQFDAMIAEINSVCDNNTIGDKIAPPVRVEADDTSWHGSW